MSLSKKRNLRIALSIVASFTFLFTTLIVESSNANNIQTTPDYLFRIESAPESFTFDFQDQADTTPTSPFVFSFPQTIKSNQDLAVLNALKDTRYILSNQTELQTLKAIFSEGRFHSKLEEGQVIFDARQTSKSVQTIQVGNTFLKPFTNGIYYLSKNNNQYTIGSLQGSFTLGVYDGNGQLETTLLIHRYQEVNFEGSLDPRNIQVKSLSSNNLLDNFKFSEYYGLDQNVLEGELFQLTFKGKTVTPTDSKKIQASLSSLNFNQRKKNFLEVYPFYKKLEDAKQAIRRNQTDQVSLILAEARQIYTSSITENPESQSLYAETANANLELIAGLNPLSKYNILKIFLADTFSSSLDNVSGLKLALSLLEDINYGYDNSKPDISVRSEQVLSKVVESQGLQDVDLSNKVNLVIVIDNIISTYPQALTSQLFSARETIISQIQEDSIDDNLVAQLEAQKINFIQDTIDRAKSGVLDLDKAKSISFTIIKTLPDDLQDIYRQQLNQLDQ